MHPSRVTECYSVVNLGEFPEISSSNSHHYTNYLPDDVMLEALSATLPGKTSIFSKQFIMLTDATRLYAVPKI